MPDLVKEVVLRTIKLELKSIMLRLSSLGYDCDDMEQCITEMVFDLENDEEFDEGRT